MLKYNEVFYMYERLDQGLVIMVLFEKDYRKKIALKFIDTIRNDLLETFSLNQLNEKRTQGIPEYKPNLEKFYYVFKEKYADKLRMIREEVGELQEQMEINLEKLFKRNEKIDSLLGHVDRLEDKSYRIQQKVA